VERGREHDERSCWCGDAFRDLYLPGSVKSSVLIYMRWAESAFRLWRTTMTWVRNVQAKSAGTFPVARIVRWHVGKVVDQKYFGRHSALQHRTWSEAHGW
jgi:hypothetical protein